MSAMKKLLFRRNDKNIRGDRLRLGLSYGEI